MHLAKPAPLLTEPLSARRDAVDCLSAVIELDRLEPDSPLPIGRGIG